MASTNKTTNYDLSQFLGSDKPAWLGDYNSDMNKIDTGIHTAQTTATAADGKATSNTTAIGDLTNLSTTAKTDLVSAINEVDTNTDTAQAAATVAVNKATLNESAIQDLEAYLNINTFTTPQLQISGGTINNSAVYTASNSDGSLGKIYGWIQFTVSSPAVSIVIPTSLRPTQQINIAGACLVMGGVSGFPAGTLHLDGNYQIVMQNLTVGTQVSLWLPPVLLFAKAFGEA